MKPTVARKRELPAKGTLAAKRRPSCDVEHRGPFQARPEITEWMEGMAAEFNLQRGLVYVDCRSCGSTVALPAGRRAA